MALMIEVNLLPAEYRVVRNQYKWMSDRRVIYSTLAAVVFIVIGWLIFFTMQASLASTQSHIDALNAEIHTYDTVKAQIKALEDLKSKQDKKIQALKSISVSKMRWVRILEDLNASVPPHTWIISIKEEGNNVLAIEGRTYVFQEVAQFMLQLDRRPYFDAPKLDKIEQTSVSVPGATSAPASPAGGASMNGTPGAGITTASNESTSAFAFTLHCPLSASLNEQNALDADKGGLPNVH